MDTVEMKAFHMMENREDAAVASYSWDDNDGGYRGGSRKGSSGGGNGTGLLIFAICLAAAVGVFNELLGVIILIVFAFIIWTKN